MLRYCSVRQKGDTMFNVFKRLWNSLSGKCAWCGTRFGVETGGFLDNRMKEKGVVCPKCGRQFCIGCVLEKVELNHYHFTCECQNDKMVITPLGIATFGLMTVREGNLAPGGKDRVSPVVYSYDH